MLGFVLPFIPVLVALIGQVYAPAGVWYVIERTLGTQRSPSNKLKSPVSEIYFPIIGVFSSEDSYVNCRQVFPQQQRPRFMDPVHGVHIHWLAIIRGSYNHRYCYWARADPALETGTSNRIRS